MAAARDQQPQQQPQQGYPQNQLPLEPADLLAQNPNHLPPV